MPKTIRYGTFCTVMYPRPVWSQRKLIRSPTILSAGSRINFQTIRACQTDLTPWSNFELVLDRWPCACHGTGKTWTAEPWMINCCKWFYAFPGSQPWSASNLALQITAECRASGSCVPLIYYIAIMEEEDAAIVFLTGRDHAALLHKVPSPTGPLHQQQARELIASSQEQKIGIFTFV